MERKWRNKKARKGGNQLPAILEEENGNASGSVISNDFGNGGDQSTLPEQHETNAEEKALWNVELGGGDDVIMGDIVDVVGAERLELRKGEIQIAREQQMDEERRVLTAMGLMGRRF